MKKLLLLFLTTSLLVATSCSKDDDVTPAPRSTVTKANVLVIDGDGNPVENMIVYAQSEDNYDTNGASSTNANFQATTGTDGIAKFENIYSETDFNSANNFTNLYSFSIFITSGSSVATYTVGETFTSGQEKTLTIQLF